MALPAWVSRYIGLPYADTPGPDPRAGTDCWGLYSLVLAEQAGVVLPPYQGPLWLGKESSLGVARAAVLYASQFETVALGEAQVFDGLLLRIEGAPIHVGMVVDPKAGWMLHVERGCNAVVERYRDSLWRNRVVRCCRTTQGVIDAVGRRAAGAG